MPIAKQQQSQFSKLKYLIPIGEYIDFICPLLDQGKISIPIYSLYMISGLDQDPTLSPSIKRHLEPIAQDHWNTSGRYSKHGWSPSIGFHKFKKKHRSLKSICHWYLQLQKTVELETYTHQRLTTFFFMAQSAPVGHRQFWGPDFVSLLDLYSLDEKTLYLWPIERLKLSDLQNGHGSTVW